MKKKVIAILLCLIMVLGLWGCGNGEDATGDDGTSAEPIEISMGHALSEGTPACEGIAAFAETVKERTKGRVVIEVFPNSQLGSETEMLEQIQIGSIEAGAIMCGSMQALDMRMAIEDLPYMWKDIEHARAAYDGEFGEYLAQIMADQGMTEIGYVEWGYRHITNNKKSIVTPEDMRGMSIRVAQTALRVEAFEQIGALPTVLAFNELYGALQQGVVDAQENPLPTIAAANLNEVQKYLSLSGHFYNTVMMVVKTDVWDKISEEDQAIILEEAAKMKDRVREENSASEADTIQLLKDRGMEVNDDVDTDAFREAMAPVYDKWEKEVFGTEMMDIYRAASGW